jgi:hypothetical protein
MLRRLRRGISLANVRLSLSTTSASPRHMNLTPTELERLTILSAAQLARRYRSLDIRLSHPEAVALITDALMTARAAPSAMMI